MYLFLSAIDCACDVWVPAFSFLVYPGITSYTKPLFLWVSNETITCPENTNKQIDINTLTDRKTNVNKQKSQEQRWSSWGLRKKENPKCMLQSWEYKCYYLLSPFQSKNSQWLIHAPAFWGVAVSFLVTELWSHALLSYTGCLYLCLYSQCSGKAYLPTSTIEYFLWFWPGRMPWRLDSNRRIWNVITELAGIEDLNHNSHWPQGL